MLLQEGEVFAPRRTGRCTILLAGSGVLAIEPRIDPRVIGNGRWLWAEDPLREVLGS